ncbi:MAG TPA: M50 family metallopeptidase [Elusimicrobiales bacterium]|nr:M50 family metallopeptidase [Elusimicrobiales bacterium]
MARTLTALALTPFTAASILATAALLFTALTRYNAALPLLAGAALYSLLHFHRPGNRFFYVLAHELSHALAALMSGVKIRKISVRRNGGYVALNSGSAFISLAPYFIPFYAVAAGAAYAVAAFFADMSPFRPVFTGIAGFFLAFHVLNTGDVLAGPRQSDLTRAGGVFFSFAVVLLLNSLALALALKLLFPELVSLKGYAASVWSNAGRIADGAISAASYCANVARIYLRKG